jgi:hypothetical protein
VSRRHQEDEILRNQRKLGEDEGCELVCRNRVNAFCARSRITVVQDSNPCHFTWLGNNLYLSCFELLLVINIGSDISLPCNGMDGSSITRKSLRHRHQKDDVIRREKNAGEDRGSM